MGQATHVELEPVGFWFTTPFGRNFPKDDGDLNQYQTGVEFLYGFSEFLD